jgi:hypothetical protein
MVHSNHILNISVRFEPEYICIPGLFISGDGNSLDPVNLIHGIQFRYSKFLLHQTVFEIKFYIRFEFDYYLIVSIFRIILGKRKTGDNNKKNKQARNLFHNAMHNY